MLLEKIVFKLFKTKFRKSNGINQLNNFIGARRIATETVDQNMMMTMTIHRELITKMKTMITRMNKDHTDTATAIEMLTMILSMIVEVIETENDPSIAKDLLKMIDVPLMMLMSDDHIRMEENINMKRQLRLLENVKIMIAE